MDQKASGTDSEVNLNGKLSLDQSLTEDKKYLGDEPVLTRLRASEKTVPREIFARRHTLLTTPFRGVCLLSR